MATATAAKQEVMQLIPSDLFESLHKVIFLTSFLKFWDTKLVLLGFQLDLS